MRAAILDVDGTLVDTNYHHAIAWYRAFRRHGVVPPVWRVHRHIGMGGDQLVEAVAGAEVEGESGDGIRSARELADGWTTSADVEATKPEPGLVRAVLEVAVFESVAQLREGLEQTPFGG